MPSTIAIGSKYEKEVEEYYKGQGYQTHRNIKSRFGTQDIFGIGDILATKAEKFIIIACAVGRFQSKTIEKIKSIRPHLPREIEVVYWVKKGNVDQTRRYDRE